jgi:hypothetical protein
MSNTSTNAVSFATQWAENTPGGSFGFNYSSDEQILWFHFAIGWACLLHSAYQKRGVWNSVRVCADVAAIGTIGNTMCLLLASFLGVSFDSFTTAIILVIGGDLFSLVISIADNYMIFQRFSVIYQSQQPLISTAHKIVVVLFVVVSNYLTWW